VSGIHAFTLLLHDPVIATAAAGSPQGVPVHGTTSHGVGGGGKVPVPAAAVTAVAVAMAILPAAAVAAGAGAAAAVVAPVPKVGQGV